MTTKRSVTMSLDSSLVDRAKAAGINFSATFSAALDAELRQVEAKKWREENRDAIDALNRFHDENGCFSDDYRTF